MFYVRMGSLVLNLSLQTFLAFDDTPTGLENSNKINFKKTSREIETIRECY